MRIIMSNKNYKGDLKFLNARYYNSLAIWGRHMWSSNCYFHRGGKIFINKKPHP